LILTRRAFYNTNQPPVSIPQSPRGCSFSNDYVRTQPTAGAAFIPHDHQHAVFYACFPLIRGISYLLLDKADMKKFLSCSLITFGIAGLFILILALRLTPGYREYTRRILSMGRSDVHDYLRFPERAIKNPEQPFILHSELHPEWFTTIEYMVKGETIQSSVDALMEKIRTQALIILKDGKIVYEKYYNGYQRDSIVTSFSTVKSVNSALIGMAIDEGLIAGVEDRVVEYLPELKGRGIDEMTLRDLLKMSSGIAYRSEDDLFPLLGAPFSDDAKTYYYPDLRSLAFDEVQHGAEQIGASMHYNNYHPILEGMILERATGMPVAAYLEKKIWQPLGMEFPASWSLDSTATGFEKMESGLNGRAIDFARFGLLFQQNGSWNGQQLISGGWVTESTAPDPGDTRDWPYWPEYKENGGYYQYHWWGHVRADGHYDYTAAGSYGQYIYVCPQKNLVIVRFGEDDEPVDSFREVLFALEEMLP
jgi:CubicO group peptidase (beta-lactamase class C family)